jgi:hypothetical protein
MSSTQDPKAIPGTCAPPLADRHSAPIRPLKTLSNTSNVFDVVLISGRADDPYIVGWVNQEKKMPKLIFTLFGALLIVIFASPEAFAKEHHVRNTNASAYVLPQAATT